MLRPTSLIVLVAALASCSKQSAPTGDPPTEPRAQPVLAASGASPTNAPSAKARVGAEAPDFDLVDLDGARVRLSTFLGKIVVLEWFNPDCPFVKMSHTKGSLVDTAARHAKAGVVWIAVNSGAPGKQGHGVEKNRAGKEKFGLAHPILLDEEGRVGMTYGAERTPHVFVIDAKGVLVYRGAIDNSPDGERQSPQGGTLVNHVDAALADLAAGRPVATPETKPYGCSVKYGS